jgi:TRAP-type C4-dicarboxylate transport system permease large subunit
MSTNNKPGEMQVLNRTLGEWFSSLPLFILLSLALIISSGEMLHGQMLRLGEQFFGDPSRQVQYFLLRADPTAPDCDPNADVDAEVKKLSTQSSGSSDIDALFSDSPVDPAALRQSVLQSVQLCKDKFKMYAAIKAHITPGLKAYRAMETSFFWVFHAGMDNRPLLLLAIVFVAGITTTLRRHHISLRPAHTVVENRVQAVAMTLGNVMLVASVLAHLRISMNSGVAIDKPEIFYLWITMFSILSLISMFQIFFVPHDAAPGGNVFKGLLSIPLYSFMAVNAGIFFLTRQHWGGLSIYINQMLEFSGLFLNLALYIWIGMLLKQTRFVDMFLDVLRPWKMSPEALTYCILILSAYPTAYTGASAIFVIAAGSLIYHEVRRAGGNAQFALAASAMSGSLGGVLKPCLLVVFIAALNKQVTTSELFHWGFYVFLLTSTLFFIVSQFYRDTESNLAPPRVAIPGMVRAFMPLLPYIGLVMVVVFTYRWGLNTKLDEFTAPIIIPAVMLVLVVFDQWKRKREMAQGKPFEEAPIGLEKAMRYSTNETTAHIGALIMLMTLSQAMGGVVERSGVMEHAPHSFPNLFVAMTFLMISKVILGMFMDPMGAMILVSGTLAPIAYNAGVNPIHFWMMVLVAFELGYLLPPVAINQLMLRQVVGYDEVDRVTEEARKIPSFMRRYQRWILPIMVMAIGLVVVTYGGLFIPDFYPPH